MCEKLLFMDGNASNVDFVGLMATMAGCLAICFLSVLGPFFAAVERKGAIFWSASRRVAIKTYRWLRGMSLVARKAIIVAWFLTIFNSQSLRIRAARSSYVDDDYATKITKLHNINFIKD